MITTVIIMMQMMMIIITITVMMIMIIKIIEIMVTCYDNNSIEKDIIISSQSVTSSWC